MKVREICEKLRSGEITLDYAGHYIGIDAEWLLAQYDDNVLMENGGNDGNWSRDKGDTPETIESMNVRMREFYKSGLDTEVEQEGDLRLGLLHDATKCLHCGERLHWTLTGNKLQLRNHMVDDPDIKWKWANYPIDYVCPYSVPKPVFGEIKVASRLLIANFFRFDDTPEGKEYSDEYSLNCLAGRKAISEFKAKNQNVAYGQMGNMSIGVYVNDVKDSVIIGPSYHPDELDDDDDESEEMNSLFPGYTLVGLVCLDVWRWEATDLNTLGDKYKDASERDLVEIDVQHGVWTFQHNYDVIRQTERGVGEKDFNYIFARLDLKK